MDLPAMYVTLCFNTKNVRLLSVKYNIHKKITKKWYYVDHVNVWTVWRLTHTMLSTEVCIKIDLIFGWIHLNIHFRPRVGDHFIFLWYINKKSIIKLFKFKQSFIINNIVCLKTYHVRKNICHQSIARRSLNCFYHYVAQLHNTIKYSDFNFLISTLGIMLFKA